MKIGIHGKLYYNTGTYGTPVWNLITNIESDELGHEAEKVEVTARGEFFKLFEPGQIDSGLEGTITYRDNDEDWIYIEGKLLDRAEVDLLYLDDLVTVDETPGWRIAAKCHKASRQSRVANQPYKLDFAFFPCVSANQAGPIQYEVAV